MVENWEANEVHNLRNPERSPGEKSEAEPSVARFSQPEALEEARVGKVKRIQHSEGAGGEEARFGMLVVLTV